MSIALVVERWSNVLEKSQSDIQLKQVRACAEIGVQCMSLNPVERPNTQHIVNRLNETETMDSYTGTDVMTSQQAVESGSNMLEKSRSGIQLKQVRVCAEIGVQCIISNPVNTQHIINRLNGTETMDSYTGTDVMTSQQEEHVPNELNQDMTNTPEETISEEDGPYTSLWSRYRQLNPNTRPCIEYCRIFPRGYRLRKDKLVCQWIAQEYVKTSSATEEKEDVAEGYIEEFLSLSFLQQETCDSDLIDCFTLHSGVHEFLDNVARTCFRIENKNSHEGWVGDVPRDVQHIFVEKYDEQLFTKIFELENISTLIIEDAPTDLLVEEEFIERISKRLLKLRVLSIDCTKEPHSANRCDIIFSIPESISQLKHLHYLAFRPEFYCKITLPSTLNKLQHIRLLDFGDRGSLGYPYFIADLVTLRHIFYRDNKGLPNISKLTSLRTIPMFTIRYGQGYEIKQLRNLNNLHGSLVIKGLENVKGKEEALGANLVAKKWLTGLELHESEEEVLEGLCTPVGLKYLMISCYRGLTYPDWMVGKQNGGPKELQHLKLWYCGQSGGLAPQLCEAFPNLRELVLEDCEFDTLPGNMELLTSLKYLSILNCKNIQSLPTLPESLEKISIPARPKFVKSCQKVGHPNWEKIKHIPTKRFDRLYILRWEQLGKVLLFYYTMGLMGWGLPPVLEKFFFCFSYFVFSLIWAWERI
ncbi:unnamed protein product [Alopecurus aequalis]